ncbi:MAG TPA: hypothetical protein VMW85_03340 [Methanomassiliicoccales archaeon]|nr:hypothetical protein [Methanomassiliicoccales archaeon]
MFGAVICPRCRKGFAVDLEHRSSSCPHCGRQIQVRRMKVHFSSSSASLTAQAVGELNRKGRELKSFDGEIEQKTKRTVFSPVQIEILIRELEEFDLAELEEKLAGRMVMSPDELLRRMLSLGLVYESSPGRYRRA